MEKLFENLREDVVIINRQGTIRYCNERLRINLEYEKEKLEEKYLTELIEDEVLVKQLLQVPCVIKQPIFIDLKTRKGKVLPYQVKVAKGSWKGQENLFLIGKEVVQEAYTKEQLHMILKQLPFKIGVKSVDGRYVYANGRACNGKEVLNQMDQDIFGKVIGSAFDEEDFRIMQSRIPKVVEHFEERIDGKSEVIEVHKLPFLDQEGEVIGLIKISKNKTIDKMLEQQKEESYKKLFKLDQELEEETLIKMSCKGPDVERVLLDAFQADGMNIWVYNKEQHTLISKFRGGICEQFIQEIGSNDVSSEVVKEQMLNKEHIGFYPIEESPIKGKRSYLKSQGIGYVRVCHLGTEEEFVGVMIILYKDKQFSQTYSDKLLQIVCNKISAIIKQYTLSTEVRSELQRRKKVEQGLQYFLETATDVMMVSDEKGRIHKVSKSFCEIVGKTKGEVIGTLIFEYMHREDREWTKDRLKLEVLQGKNIIHIKNRWINLLGEITCLEWRIKYLEAKKTFVCTATNHTRTNEAQEQWKIYKRKAELENLKNEFFYNISHEFKTPLNIILTAIQLMEGEKLAGQTKYSKYIKQNAYRLLNIINNLIDMTQIESGYYQMKLGRYEIVEIVKEITGSITQYAEYKKIELKFKAEVEESWIICDPEKIERIMLNLLSNAIKYVDEQGKILVEIEYKQKNIAISVEDNGIGIPEYKLETIFKRFEQIDNLNTRQHQGSGIGLSLVKALVELHQGQVYIESKVGKGTKITFELPREVQLKQESILGDRHKGSDKVERCHIDFQDIYD